MGKNKEHGSRNSRSSKTSSSLCLAVQQMAMFTSGQLPLLTGIKVYWESWSRSKKKDAYEAAKICALNCLSVIKGVVGDLDRLNKLLRVNGCVASEGLRCN